MLTLQVTLTLFDAHCCHMGTAIKHLVPDQVKPSFVIFDIRALWCSALNLSSEWENSYLSLTHSLTHCCAWPVEGRSDLHNEQLKVVNWQALMGWPISSFTCWSQVSRGRFQSVAGGVPVKASMVRCNACETGVSLMWLKSVWRRLAMRKIDPLTTLLWITTAQSKC